VSKALYRKYRSTSLDEVVGQEHITRLLKRALETDRVAHAYLFTGPRGVGKTSIARIMAYEINKLPYAEDAHHLDIIEIDAASNNGVEDVRDLREKVQIAPVSAKKKVYIIDEVHMLSKPAFNALLKTLEEPPEHIVFILATTDVNKLPATIISRTQHYGFRTIAPATAAAHLKTIATAEKIAIDDDALLLIAERGHGSFRDSISLLDQVANLHDGKEPISAALIEDVLGLASTKHMEKLLDAYQAADISALAAQLDAIESEGIDASVLAGQLIHFVRSRAAAHPELLSLLDALLDVPKSAYPGMKLLSVLGTPRVTAVSAPATPSPAPKPKTVALAAPAPEITASVASLKKAVEPAPTPQPEAAAPIEPPKKKTATPIEPADFNWEALVEHVRQSHVALYSVLSKCSPELDGQSLKLYTGSAFYKKKLDDTKYSTHLYESMHELGMVDIEITTVPERAPLKDSQASAIADIMGGGVEVAPGAL